MISLTIDGQRVETSEDPATPLLWILRDTFQKRGVKYGCGQGLCGACTVLVDGQAVRACKTSLQSVAGKEITTIEGLSPNGSHPLQQAWVEESVPQCGYCQAGQIMNAAALLKANPHPTLDEIRNHMNGNICRCGTYQRIEKAIVRASNL